MRSLILSDLHANWEALEAVVKRAAGRFDRVLCLGDLVGYGADPNRVTAWVRANAAAVVRGNHDRACSGMDDLSWFNPIARAAAEWTQGALNPENLAYLRALPRGPADAGGLTLAHGSPVDEDEYVATVEEASLLEGHLPAPRCFFGHTHLQGAFEYRRGRVVRPHFALRQPARLARDSWYLVNPGSAGQPRDGDWRAAYAIYDDAEDLLTYERTEYDVARAQRKIVEAGLPEILAFRLETGE